MSTARHQEQSRKCPGTHCIHLCEFYHLRLCISQQIYRNSFFTTLRSAMSQGDARAASATFRQVVDGECLTGTWLADNQLFVAALYEFAAGGINSATGKVFPPMARMVLWSPNTGIGRWPPTRKGETVTLERDDPDFGAYTPGADGTTVSFVDRQMESEWRLIRCRLPMQISPSATRAARLS